MSGARSRAQRRMIRSFEKYGAKHFRVLRSAETGLRRFKRPKPPVAARATASEPTS